jgi:hypothetical protein
MTGNWLGALSLGLGSIGISLPFAARVIDFDAFGEDVGVVFSIVLTWLAVLLPVIALAIGVGGLIRDRRKALALMAVLMNCAGIGLAAFIVFVLAG